MTRLFTYAVSIFFLVSSLQVFAQNYDYLLTATDTGSGSTTNNSQAWTDLTSVTVDVTNISYLYLSATINMSPDGSNNSGREGNYNIYQSDDPTNNSGIIKRQIIQNSEPGVESWGLGAIVHIFDVSALTGNKTFTLEHSNQSVSSNGRNVYSFARLSAVALTTTINGHELSNDCKTLSTYVSTTSSTYTPIPGLESDAISLPFKGDIYVALSINGKANSGGTVAEYKLEYSTDNGATYNDLGITVKRSMFNTHDDGIISLTAMINDQEPGDQYKVRVSHKRELGSDTVYSGNGNLVTISLAHEGGGYFPSFSSSDGTGGQITGVSTPTQHLTSASFTTPEDIGSIAPQMFVSTQYLVNASGLSTSSNPKQRMRARNQLWMSDGTNTLQAEDYYRYIEANGSFGAGGFLGLTEDLAELTNYTIGMQHDVAYVSNPDATEDETLYTSAIIACGFQTFDQPHYLWNGSVSTAWELDANWAYGKAPTDSTHEVTIPSAVNSPIISGSTIRECGSLNVRSGGSIQINDNSALQPSASIENNGTITLGHNASLIQTVDGADENSGSGTYTVVRTGGTSAYGYNMWSSPIQSASISGVFSSSNPCDIWVFDKNSQSWSYDYSTGYSTSCNGNPVTFTSSNVISGGDGVMDIGSGYFTPGGVAATKTFTGDVNNGDILVPIATTSLGNPGGSDWADDDWNLIGNPYPCALNATEFWNENAVNNSRIATAIYFWDDADTSGGYNQNSDYASWNLSGGVNSGNSATTPSGYIASGQGFWVYAAATTNLVFDNSMRSNNNDQFFKTEQTDNHNVWVNITSPSSYQNNILVGFNSNCTDGVDASYDAHKLSGNPHIRFSSVINNEEFSIQSFAPIDLGETKTIPLVVFTDETGVHTFQEYKRENIPTYYSVYLYDAITKTTHELTQGSYSTSLTANQEYKNRFALIFKYNVSQNDDGQSSKPNSSTIDVTAIADVEIESQYRILTNSEECTISNLAGINGQIKITDVTGKIMWNSVETNSASTVTINIQNLSSGIYFMQIIDNESSIYHHQFYK
jgi:hypothetical protein